LSGWLLDTNVVSELRRPRCHVRVREWVETQPNEALYLSRITIAEIRYGIERARAPRLRQELSRWLQTTLIPWFGERILEIDEAVLIEWRRMVERGRAVGHTFSQPDLFLAATAAVHGLTVATRNVGDFSAAGVSIVNPWQHGTAPTDRSV
jgi:predicted nucleic acid-binding protein